MNEIHEVGLTGMKLAELCSGVQRFFDAPGEIPFSNTIYFSFYPAKISDDFFGVIYTKLIHFSS